LIKNGWDKTHPDVRAKRTGNVEACLILLCKELLLDHFMTKHIKYDKLGDTEKDQATIQGQVYTSICTAEEPVPDDVVADMVEKVIIHTVGSSLP
jgi:hypothetical protein